VCWLTGRPSRNRGRQRGRPPPRVVATLFLSLLRQLRPLRHSWVTTIFFGNRIFDPLEFFRVKKVRLLDPRQNPQPGCWAFREHFAV
jgi:hypothetical protein